MFSQALACLAWKGAYAPTSVRARAAALSTRGDTSRANIS